MTSRPATFRKAIELTLNLLDHKLRHRVTVHQSYGASRGRVCACEGLQSGHAQSASTTRFARTRRTSGSSWSQTDKTDLGGRCGRWARRSARRRASHFRPLLHHPGGRRGNRARAPSQPANRPGLRRGAEVRTAARRWGALRDGNPGHGAGRLIPGVTSSHLHRRSTPHSATGWRRRPWLRRRVRGRIAKGCGGTLSCEQRPGEGHFVMKTTARGNAA